MCRAGACCGPAAHAPPLLAIDQTGRRGQTRREREGGRGKARCLRHVTSRGEGATCAADGEEPGGAGRERARALPALRRRRRRRVEGVRRAGGGPRPAAG